MLQSYRSQGCGRVTSVPERKTIMDRKWLLLLALAAGPACAQFSVHVQVGDPAYYGPLYLDSGARPALVYTQPVVVERRVVYGDPLYLRVPPGHAKHWTKHCARYNACARPVYFVRDDWYRRAYVPHHHGKPEHHGPKHGHGHHHH